MSCTHSNFSHTNTHTRHISCRYGIPVTGAFEQKTPLFLHHSLSLSLHRQLSGASGCYHAQGNQRYSHMSQIGVNSYYTGEGGLKASENSLIRKDIAAAATPPSVSFSICPTRARYHFFFFPFTGRWYLTNNTKCNTSSPLLPATIPVDLMELYSASTARFMFFYKDGKWACRQGKDIHRFISALIPYDYYQVICWKLVWFIAQC